MPWVFLHILGIEEARHFIFDVHVDCGEQWCTRLITPEWSFLGHVSSQNSGKYQSLSRKWYMIET